MAEAPRSHGRGSCRRGRRAAEEVELECFDIIADNAVLYPVVHVKTVSASWDDPSTALNGEALDGFKGIGTTSISFQGRCDRQGVRLA